MSITSLLQGYDIDVDKMRARMDAFLPNKVTSLAQYMAYIDGISDTIKYTQLAHKPSGIWIYICFILLFFICY